jgi:peptidoglycan/LPS O-acetylase OafA/YrhL
MSKGSQHESCLAGDSSNLDLLRSVAVLFVVANHLFVVSGRFFVGPLNVQELGRLGVLFFFVHTCCVLMCSIARQESKAPGQSIALSFFVRRAFRIYPLSVFTVAFVSIFALPLGHFQNGTHVAVHLDRLGLFANYFLVQDIANRPSILVTLWSLPYEMHMYLLLPILYLLIKHRDGFYALTIL